jgi:succinate dehydrogenase flavin-adding protein (antitoxin of CptAB toxin-antitoxin module)
MKMDRFDFEDWKRDPVVVKTIHEFKRRSAVGFKKYGTTLAENDLSLLQWLQHAKEEAMDQVLYLQRAIDEIRRKENSI